MALKFDHRANMRGICKCPHCGTFNGNRALKCKNPVCKQTLKETPRPAKCGPTTTVVSAVQLLPTDGTTNSTRLHSVSHRDGLRTIFHSTIGTDGTIATLTTIHGKDIADEESVKRTISCCKSSAEAVPLLKDTVNSLAVPEEEKVSLWEKHSHHGGGPLVQRVSNELFVVGRWQAAYGMVHVTAVKKHQKYTHFQCECQADGEQKSSPPIVCWHIRAVAAGLLSAPFKYGDRWSAALQPFIGQPSAAVLEHASVHDEKSVHACEYLLAPGNYDDRYISVPSEHVEMQSMLNSTMMELFSDQQIGDLQIYQTTSNLSPTTGISDMFADAEESLHLMDCQIELMDELDPTDRIDFCPSFIECEDSLPVPETVEHHPAPDEKVVRITAKKGALKRSGRMGVEKLTRGSYSVRKLMKALESNGIIFNRLQQSKGGGNNGPTPAPPYEATQCSLSFTGWLESVIEQLNSVIDYNADGKPAVQSFRIHEDFFRCLRARFSVGHRLRQPEPEMETDQSSQRYKFTHHKSLLHVFRTDKIGLCFEKRFTRGPDDRYVPFAEDEVLGGDGQQLFGQEPSIRPHCYTTYIKLGRYKHEPDPDRVYNFSLEWIGSVLPRSRFGELRISFEYGHRMNKQYMEPPATAATTPAHCTEGNIQRE